MIILELRKRAFLGEVPIESFTITAVVIDHVVLLNPFHLAKLGRTQREEHRLSPPVSWPDLARATPHAVWVRAKASIVFVVPKACYEGCQGPVSLNPSTLGCPLICVPQTWVSIHGLWVWEVDLWIVVVAEDSNWDTIDKPPAKKIKKKIKWRIANHPFGGGGECRRSWTKVYNNN